MTAPRSTPYIHVTYLPKLLAGEACCEWASWFKAHFEKWPKTPSDFDQAKWVMNHTALLNETRELLVKQGYTVLMEYQNKFTLTGSSGIQLGGHPDLIATKGNNGLVIDAKTGKAVPSHAIQVMIYMWALPRAKPQLRGITFGGRVVYPDQRIKIAPEEIDDTFTARLVDLIRRVGGEIPSRKIPTPSECQWCAITDADCPERMRFIDESIDGVTDEF